MKLIIKSIQIIKITIHHFKDYDHYIFYQRLKEHMHETTVSQFNIAENVADLYKEKQVFTMVAVKKMSFLMTKKNCGECSQSPERKTV